jgi:hypothetical protein
VNELVVDATKQKLQMIFTRGWIRGGRDLIVGARIAGLPIV